MSEIARFPMKIASVLLNPRYLINTVKIRLLPNVPMTDASVMMTIQGIANSALVSTN